MKKLLAGLIFTALAVSAQAEPASHAISMYGDVKYPAGFTHFDYVNPDAPKGGTLKMPDVGTFDNLNPYILKGNAAEGSGLLSDTLMAASQDETGTNYGLIAESVEWPKSNEWIIFNLNPAAKFSDGSKVTADDVIFSFNTLIAKGHPIYRMYYGDVAKVEKLGDHKVKFYFKNPENKEMKIILGQIPVFSKTYYDKVDFEKTTLKAPLGSGPYIVEKLQQGRSITYKRRDDYWATNLPVNKGRYNFDRIQFEYFKDANVAIQAFKSGVVDLRYENIAKNWATSYNIPQVKDGRIKKEKIKNSIPIGMQGFAMNIRRDKFSDWRVRKALMLALDFEWMNKNLFYDSYIRTNSYFSNSIYAATSLPEGKELAILERYRGQVPDDVFTKEFTIPKTDGSGNLRAQLLEARKLLSDAGWNIKNGKLTNAKGQVFTIEFLTQNGSSFGRLMPSYYANLKLLGIDAHTRLADASVFKKLTDDFDFDMVVNGWPASLSPGNELLDYWNSASADVPGSRNWVGAKDKVIDELVKGIITAEDKESLVASVKALDRVLLWNYFVVPQWNLPFFRILYWDKYEHPAVTPKYDSQFGLYTWWAKNHQSSTSR